MNDKGQQSDWAMFRDNLFRDILGVARAYQSDVMGLLTQYKGHDGLRLSFHPVITGLPADGLRVTELAQQLGMSKQNCFQLLKPIALAGYIERAADTRDKRARKICLTERGQQLIDDGTEVIARIDTDYRDRIGDDAFGNIEQQLRRLCSGLRLPPLSQERHLSSAGGASIVGIGLMQLAQHCTQALMGLTIDRGHSNLRLSFGQVLLHIGTDGARMQDIARINDVSKQAIGQIVAELEQLGYLERIADPGDGRSKILYFTEAGLGLINDSVAAARDLEQSYAAVTGAAALRSLQRDLHQLYCKFPGSIKR
jgi:DNA-binding MarR family transcriptional regulator